MASIRQKKVARGVADNATLDKPLTGGEIVENSGYGVSMKKNPQVVLKSKGVQEELKILGFDSDTAKSVVGEILIAGDSDLSRLAAAREIFKVNGDYAPDKSISVNVDAEPSDRIKELARKLRDLQ